MQKKSKIRPNDPCPCNSGKKFKKCHGQQRIKPVQLRGKAARDAIINRLVAWPEAKKIAEDVTSFYGDYICYYENINFPSSHYEIELSHEPLFFKKASIQLQLCSHRIAEALCHELLHLHLRMRGYPIGERISIPDELDQYAKRIIKSYSKINNLIEHEINIDMFLELGFNKSDFLGYHSSAPNYQNLALKALPTEGYISEIGFSWWCLEFFRHWISSRHGVGEEASRDAQNALYWGSRVHPELTQATSKIRNLIESGKIKRKGEYSEHVNTLLELMRIPKYTGWAVLVNQGKGKPVAIRLQ